MRIAVFHELHEGGARKAVNELSKRLKNNHQVDLYIVDNKRNDIEEKSFSNGFFYEFITKEWRGKDWKTRFYKDTIELFQLKKLHKFIAKTIDNKNYDVVFVHPSQYTQAPFILRFLKTKSIYYCEEPLRIAYEEDFEVDPTLPFFKYNYEKSMRFLRKQIDRRNIKGANHILANSKYSQRYIKYSYGLDSTVCYLGVDAKLFKPRDINKEYDILYIGAKNKLDGYFLLEEAIKKLKYKPKIKWHIFSESWLENEKEFVMLYLKSRIVICLAKNEPFGLIPLEAMACGVPVLALHEGGYKESVIDKKTGFFVTRSAQDIANKVDTILKNKKLQNTLSTAAREHVLENWTWEKSANQLENILIN